MRGFLVILLSLWVSTANAQDAACKCCNAQSSAFDFWLGEWNVTDAAGKAAGQNSIDKIQNGCVLRENWTSASPGYTGTSYNFYNYESKKWQQLWLDNQGGSLQLVGERVGNQMIMSSEQTTNNQGQEVQHRITWTLKDDGSVRQLWETTTGTESQVVFDGLYKKTDQ
jgi:hypothetical protein